MRVAAMRAEERIERAELKPAQVSSPVNSRVATKPPMSVPQNGVTLKE
jgi:hypothetical protein